MIEKIYVSRDEVLHYSWLNGTKMDVYFDMTEIVRIPMFRQTVALLLENGIKKTWAKVFEELNRENSTFTNKEPTDFQIGCNDKYLWVSIHEKDLIPAVIATCDWVLEHNLTFPEELKEMEEFYNSNKESINTFFAEIKKILTEKSDKNYHYFFQSLDGMN